MSQPNNKAAIGIADGSMRAGAMKAVKKSNPAETLAYSLLGLSSGLMVVGLLMEKRKTLSNPHSMWVCDAIMIGWAVLVVGLLRFYVWFPQDKEKILNKSASKPGQPQHPSDVVGTAVRGHIEADGEGLDIVRKRRVRRD